MSVTPWLVAGLLAIALPAAAQETASQQPASSQPADQPGRVATTVNGDAGLWWIPVGETNGKGMWRGSAARNSRNTPQGHMNVATFTAAVSYGLGDRADVFASFDAIQRVDRDLRSLYVAADAQRGGLDTRVPYAREPWTGNKLGDLRVGTKLGLLSEAAGHPVSASAIVAINVPTADSDNGAGQGSVAADVSGVISRWISSKAVVTGTAGYNFRKNPSDPVVVHVPNNFHWGAGIGLTPTTSWLIHAEVIGDQPVRDNASLDTLLVAEDGSVSPRVSFVDRQTSFTTGVTWFASNGFFVGGEVRLDTPRLERINAPDDSRSDYLDYHVRIGWSPMKRKPAPPVVTPPPPLPPAAPVAPPAPPPAPVRAPTPVPPPVKSYTFEDVHFDFDRYTLRTEAQRVLEQALAAMKENPSLRLTLEGHTCSIGTAEYNMALGERRSNAVRDYLVQNGVATNRVTSVSYGEEKPKHDNSREETRRLNRRAALVVRLDAAPQ